FAGYVMPRRFASSAHDVPPHLTDTTPLVSEPQSSSHRSTFPNVHPELNTTSADINEVSCLRTELSLFFLSSVQRWKLTGDVPFSMFVQFLKIIIVTFQLILFGTLSSTRVSYGERAQVAFRHLYFRGWDPQYETLPYPPSTGVYGFYTRDEFYEALSFVLRRYNETELLSLNGYTFRNAKHPVTACVEQFYSLSCLSLRNVDAIPLAVCKTINLTDVSEVEISDWKRTETFCHEQGLDLDFARFRKLSLNFSLYSPPIHHTDWDRSIECFQFDVQVLFDNSGQTGQVVATLTSAPFEVVCALSDAVRQDGEPEAAPTVRRVVHLVVDLLAFNTSLVSMGLCGVSLFRGIRLWKKTKRFFKGHYGIRLKGLFFDFVNPWLFVVLGGDFLIICGSTLKLVHNRDILEAYIELSYLLGLGTLLVWISVLRYVELASQTHLLLRTIKRSVPGLLRFCACALVLYFAFVFPAWVILGPFHMKFRSFTSTLECLFSLINGDDMYTTFATIDATKGLGIYLFSRIFLYIFITLFIYAVLNIFVTIIFEAYEEVREGDGPVAGGMTVLKRFIGQPVPLSDGLNVAASRNRTPPTSSSSSPTIGATVSFTVESLVEECPVSSDRGCQRAISFGGYGDGDNVEADGEACVEEEETYFNESFESDVNVNNVPTPFKSNKPHRDVIASLSRGSSTPGTNVTTLPPPPSTQQQSQKHRRYRRHRSSVRGPISSQQQHRHRQRLQPSLESELSLEAWQASQNLIASLRSENYLLQSQLKDCRVELRTVQRQCKVQSARLTKAVGREAEMPALVDRLNAEVRAMQIQLRRKQEAVDVAERRALEAEARLLPLLEKRDHKSATISSAAPGNEQEEIKKRTQTVDALQTTLEEERRKVRDLQRKMELVDRNHKTEQATANEQIRKMRKFISDLQAQLNIVNRNLQEKTKLLELQNIYSQRLPKSVVTQTAGLEFQLERSRVSGRLGLEGDSHDGALQRYYVNHRLTSSQSPPGGANEVTGKRRRSRHTVCPISSMVAKMKNGLFTRSCTTANNSNEGDGTAVVGKESPSAAGNLLSRSRKLVADAGQNLPVPVARGRKKKDTKDEDADGQITTIRGIEGDVDSDDAAIPDLQENFDMMILSHYLDNTFCEHCKV
ncbi:Mucolipin-3, partial [Taenia solium]